jgi:hypothetical protein
LGRREYRIANQGRGEFGSKSIRYVELLPKQLTNCARLGTLGGPGKEALTRVSLNLSIAPFFLSEPEHCTWTRVSLNLSIDLISNTSKFLFLLQIQKKKTFLTADSKKNLSYCEGRGLCLCGSASCSGANSSKGGGSSSN